jgi:hypothetical protein
LRDFIDSKSGWEDALGSVATDVVGGTCRWRDVAMSGTDWKSSRSSALSGRTVSVGCNGGRGDGKKVDVLIDTIGLSIVTVC